MATALPQDCIASVDVYPALPAPTCTPRVPCAVWLIERVLCVCVCVCCVRAAEFRAIWSQCTLRNDRMRDVTGLDFRPLDESVRDCVESLISVVRCLVDDHVV
jgi:hypothetical protein